MTDEQAVCLIDGCDEPATQTVLLSREGELLEFAACREHAHDIDWGVITPERSTRGLIGPAHPETHL